MSRIKLLSLAALLVVGLPCAVAQGVSGAAPSASATTVVGAMRALTPSGVTVGEARKEGDLYIFNGTSASNQILSEFMRRAIDAPGANNVELRVVTMESGRYRYEISLKVDCTARGATDSGALCGAPGKAKSVHKCRISGAVTFQSMPCPSGTEI
jgi:hypothetical protein